jgi:hypothetical protein
LLAVAELLQTKALVETGQTVNLLLLGLRGVVVAVDRRFPQTAQEDLVVLVEDQNKTLQSEAPEILRSEARPKVMLEGEVLPLTLLVAAVVVVVQVAME